MIGGLLDRLRALFGGSDDREERTEGSGEVYRDPAYNGRYEAEREVERIAEEAEAAERDTPDRRE
ncbi:hypothetical protein BRD10_00180 [Halobacteriales archaeon SW_12_71_31]|nr:MAG: hypothetical protein BRD10_00180 [Halobacteriales archaeon SW_12_71_31]